MRRAILACALLFLLGGTEAHGYTGGRLSCSAPGGATWNFVKGERCKSIPSRIIDNGNGRSSAGGDDENYVDPAGYERIIDADNERKSWLCKIAKTVYDVRHPGPVPNTLQRVFGCDRWTQDFLYHLTHNDGQ